MYLIKESESSAAHRALADFSVFCADFSGRAISQFDLQILFNADDVWAWQEIFPPCEKIVEFPAEREM